MLSIIAMPDIHSAIPYMRFMEEPFKQVDLVILAGDMTYGHRSDLISLVEIIRESNPNILAVCGNHDRNKMDEYLEQEGISIHGSHRIIKDIAILGCGGALPFIGGYVFREDEFEALLTKANEGLDPEIPKILVAHQPPYRCLDMTTRGNNAGSKAVRRFIEETQPLVCFTGHIHEAYGIGKIGDCQVVNPGPVMGTNRYAYVEIEEGKVKTLELRQVNPYGS
jgi:Icc-related predicted phosphoesterase